MKRGGALLGLCALLGSACSRAPSELPHALRLTLPGSDGRTHDVADEIGRAKLTVFVFYSEGCACLDAHEPRLALLYEAYAARGVDFRLVSSEVSSEPRRDAEAARARGYRFPLLSDRGAHLADALGAEFATHTVVVNSEGRLVYSGGIDSDRNRLHPTAKLFLRDALDALLAGREAPSAGEALGCALRLH